MESWQFSPVSRWELIRTDMVRIMAALRRFGAEVQKSFASALLWHNGLPFFAPNGTDSAD